MTRTIVVPWRKIIVLWYPMEWATIPILERIINHLGPSYEGTVFSSIKLPQEMVALNTNETVWEAVLPSELAAYGTDYEIPNHVDLPVRNRHPSPGTVESCLLCRHVTVDCESAETFNTTLGDQQPEQLSANSAGLSYAYRLSAKATLGKLNFHEPQEITWELGREGDGIPISTLHLRDSSYVRIFPAMEEQRERALKIPYYWPYHSEVRLFKKSPLVNSRNCCRILWRMATDGRPTGLAFPL